jgi:hypothetical protein
MAKKVEPEPDYSAWESITAEDLKFLENLLEFIESQRAEEAARIAFHRSVWDAALDMTENPIFGCPSKDEKKLDH